MGAGVTGGTSIVGTRINTAFSDQTATAVEAGDIKINGQDVGAIAAGADMEAVLKLR